MGDKHVYAICFNGQFNDGPQDYDFYSSLKAAEAQMDRLNSAIARSRADGKSGFDHGWELVELPLDEPLRIGEHTYLAEYLKPLAPT